MVRAPLSSLSLIAAICVLCRCGGSALAFSSSPRRRAATSSSIIARHSSTASSSSQETPSSSSAAAAQPSSRGVSKTIVVEGTGRPVRPGDSVVVRYRCTLAPDDDGGGGGDGGGDGPSPAPLPFASSDRQRIVACDGSMIRGWDVALRSMREGERASVRVSDPAYAYGPEGAPPFVPPNSRVNIDLEVLIVEELMGGGGGGGMSGSDIAGLDGMLDGPASRPRTPAAIAAAYERRMKDRASTDAPPERDGIFGWIDKVRGSYFFGIFEGETGQEAPWYLTPSITFPIAFAVVGLAFWASLAGGAISERGAPTTDELDEIIAMASVVDDASTMMRAVVRDALMRA
ncbi:hypothetical protein ACHAW5_009155 [Stephanodiscus triporus]|uniref:peptidylprolyl isomerase n=1 Tax=Stephanodiscus triporus TaxID=2934178 RepID=A0ABD3MYN2_9STRA